MTDNDSYSAQRFYLQSEAMKAGDLAAVKGLAQEAREELLKKWGQPPTDEEWEAIKEEVDQMSFPSEVGFERGTTSHQMGKTTTHTIKSYEINLPRIKGCELIANYSVCPTCNKVWSKSLTLLRNHPVEPAKHNVCFIKEFLRHGKPVEEDTYA